MNECKLCGEPMSVPFRYCSDSCLLAADQESYPQDFEIKGDEDDIDTIASDLRKDGIDIDTLCDKVLTLINNEKDNMKNE